MKLSLDTTILVDLDRKDKTTIEVLKTLLSEGHDIFISTVVPSEIFTGAYLREDYKTATAKVRRLITRFEIVPLNAAIAETIGQINAYLIINGLPIEYPDVAIAATFISKGGDFLLTKNKRHFLNIPKLKDKVFTPAEFKEKGLMQTQS
ncbi:MAG: type II toxin-antitoxin system VapC family toxin [Candidatus Hydrothermarchaeales archaeon]